MTHSTTPSILWPTVAANRLGITVPDLVAIIRRHRYEFTEVKAGGKPGDRGRSRWGLTEAQLETIVRGQARKWTVPPPDLAAAPADARSVSPDGIIRVPQNRRTRLRPR